MEEIARTLPTQEADRTHRVATMTRPARAAWIAALACALAACASRPPPAEVDIARTGIVPDLTEPKLVIDGLSKGVGAGVGAATGSGTGVLAGSLACIATGPFFGLCLAAVLPTATMLGAATGAVVGGVRSELGDALDAKSAMLKAQLATTSYQTVLADELQIQARDDYSMRLLILPPKAAPGPVDSASAALNVRSRPAPDDADPDWLVEAAMTEVGTEGKTVFALRLVARLKFFHRGEAMPVFETAKEVQSETELTTAEWSADEAKALSGVLDLCARRAAHNLLSLVMQARASAPGRSAPPTASKYSSSCGDDPRDWKRQVRTSTERVEEMAATASVPRLSAM